MRIRLPRLDVVGVGCWHRAAIQTAASITTQDGLAPAAEATAAALDRQLPKRQRRRIIGAAPGKARAFHRTELRVGVIASLKGDAADRTGLGVVFPRRVASASASLGKHAAMINVKTDAATEPRFGITAAEGDPANFTGARIVTPAGAEPWFSAFDDDAETSTAGARTEARSGSLKRLIATAAFSHARHYSAFSAEG